MSIAKFLLPEVLTIYFDLSKYDVKEEESHFYFKELNVTSDEFKGQKIHSKDSPIRGKNVYLHITRPRWINESINKIVTRNWNLVANELKLLVNLLLF